MGAAASTYSCEDLAKHLEQRDDELVFFAFDVRHHQVDGAVLLRAMEDDGGLAANLRKLACGGGAVGAGTMETLERAVRELRAVDAARDSDSGEVVGDDDNGDGGDDDDNGDGGGEDADEQANQSIRVVRSRGSILLAGVRRGAASAVNAHELDAVGGASAAEGHKYADGLVVTQGGKMFGRIERFLGNGAMGFVYVMRYHDGVRCALKTVRSNATPQERVGLEKDLATEVAIGFACGRAAQIASVVDVLIPQPGVETKAAGLMLICDLIDGGDLEEAMHSGKKRLDGDLVHDYRGTLYSEEGAKTWPLISVMLQVLKGFDHIHNRGILHQVMTDDD